MAEKYGTLSVVELKNELRRTNARIVGKKEDLIERFPDVRTVKIGVACSTSPMKRKLCSVPAFSCDDEMEELNVASLSRRKESAAPLTGDRDTTLFHYPLTYPLALVLRLRVLQIVCGISAMVMGSVAFIEERQKFNMGLGIPAGGISVIAAAVSIHTSRGFGKTGAAIGAGAANVLWTSAVFLLLTLVVQCTRTIIDTPGFEDGVQEEKDSHTSSRDLFVIACVQIALAAATLLSAAVCLRIDCSS